MLLAGKKSTEKKLMEIFDSERNIWPENVSKYFERYFRRIQTQCCRMINENELEPKR